VLYQTHIARIVFMRKFVRQGGPQGGLPENSTSLGDKFRGNPDFENSLRQPLRVFIYPVSLMSIYQGVAAIEPLKF